MNFVEAEVAHIDPFERKVTIAHGEVEGKLPYDYLIFALGRRLATEKITGFYEHAHHLLNVDKAIKFGKAVEQFQRRKSCLGPMFWRASARACLRNSVRAGASAREKRQTRPRQE